MPSAHWPILWFLPLVVPYVMSEWSVGQSYGTEGFLLRNSGRSWDFRGEKKTNPKPTDKQSYFLCSNTSSVQEQNAVGNERLWAFPYRRWWARLLPARGSRGSGQSAAVQRRSLRTALRCVARCCPRTPRDGTTTRPALLSRSCGWTGVAPAEGSAQASRAAPGALARGWDLAY